MRRLYFDQYEFDPPDSEQDIELVISTSPRHAGLKTFLADCGVSAKSAPPPASIWPRWQPVADHLNRFAGIQLPHVSKWRELIILHDEWDDLELGIAAGPHLIYYHWSTSA
jgi:hypothetical protein